MRCDSIKRVVDCSRSHKSNRCDKRKINGKIEDESFTALIYRRRRFNVLTFHSNWNQCDPTASPLATKYQLSDTPCCIYSTKTHWIAAICHAYRVNGCYLQSAPMWLQSVECRDFYTSELNDQNLCTYRKVGDRAIYPQIQRLWVNLMIWIVV